MRGRTWKVLGGLWPGGLGGRTILVLSASVIVVHLCTMLLYRDAAPIRADSGFASEVAGPLATAATVLPQTAPPQRDARAHALSSPGLDLHWSDHADTRDGSAATVLPAFQRRVEALSPHIGAVAMRFDGSRAADGLAMLAGSVRLTDGTYLNFTSTVATAADPWREYATLISTTLMAAGVVGVAALLLRGLVRPLKRLAAAADAIGRGPAVPVPETGPDEVRHVAHAFNAMQTRIAALIEDRTQALAAVSHDLRTPLTRLRLRAGFVADPEMQEAIDADLDEMDAMIASTLAYLAGDAETERPQATDLAAMLSTLTEGIADAGGDASYAGPNHVVVAVHPSAIRRAFANLLDNAVAYGGSARVTVAVRDTFVQIAVEDDGPGIPEADLERVMEPFQRLDVSRNHSSGGVGLGLAIAQRAITRAGGSLRLVNRDGGGLRAIVSLPARGEATILFDISANHGRVVEGPRCTIGKGGLHLQNRGTAA